jgi:hypothetical protein
MILSARYIERPLNYSLSLARARAWLCAPRNSQAPLRGYRAARREWIFPLVKADTRRSFEHTQAAMEPTLVTVAKDRAVLEELSRREPIFHRPEFAGSSAQVKAMTADDFWEIGASGRRYSRQYVLKTLAARQENPVDDDWRATDFHCRELAQDLYLLTYTLLQGERLTRRASLWQRSCAGWKILFHQGTLVQEPDQSRAQ